MTPDEAAEFRPELRATGFVALGDWTPVSARIARDFAQDRRADGWVAGQESSVFTVSDSEWTALEAGGAAEREAEKEEKAGKAGAEAARIEAAPHEPVLLCWERPPFSDAVWCHRRMVADWLAETLGLEVPEIVAGIAGGADPVVHGA